LIVIGRLNGDKGGERARMPHLKIDFDDENARLIFHWR
jgi:hypothetical protein